MTRFLTALTMIALLTGSLLAPPSAFITLIGVIIIFGWREYAPLATELGAAPLRGLGPLLALGCALSFLIPDTDVTLATFMAAMVIGAIAGMVIGRQHPRLAIQRTMATWAGLLWLGLMPGAQVGIRQVEGGAAWLAFLYSAVSVGDIAAYYGGRAFGRTLLAPSLSPKKTVAGSVSGLLLSAAAGAACDFLMDLPVNLPVAAIAGAFLGLVGQMGDLAESALKRMAGMKDSSSLLPGHGGILDRIDGHLFAGTMLYVLLVSRLL